MLNITKMTVVGQEGKTSIMNFEFTFDNSPDLPKGPGYQLGQRIYVIEEGSIAVNNATSTIYKYSSGKWIKTTDKSTSTTNTITENGSYNIASNSATGTGNIDVNVEPTGLIEKDITANGTYLPAEDEAIAYSKVTVNVPINFSKIEIPIIGYSETLSGLIPAPASIKRSSDGVYTLEYPEEKLICADPLKSIIFNTDSINLFSVVFTPAENNTIVTDIESHLYVTITGDTITAGDGKRYLIYLHRDPTTGTPILTCKKSNRDFVFTIE